MQASAAVLVVDDDLFFVARIVRTLQALDLSVATSRTTEDAVAKLEQGRPAMVIVNGGSGRLDAHRVATAAKQAASSPYVLAYGPHVRLLELAPPLRAAGADRVCANSAVHARLPAMIRQVLSGGPGPDETEDD